MKNYLQKLYTWLKWKLYDEDFSLFFFFILLLVLLICCGCKSQKIIKEETITRYVDSTVISYRDSVIEVEIPVEKIVDVVPVYDSLHLENSVAKATSWVDTTTHTLKGVLENKPDGVLTKTVYLPSKERIIYKDSIAYKDKPVYITKVKNKTPKFVWWILGVLGTLVVVAYRKYIYKLFKLIATVV